MTTDGELDEWLAHARKCKYLPEANLKKLCDRVRCTRIFIIFFSNVFTIFLGKRTPFGRI